jgi:TetR/AcrR family transcriptional regulator, mexJK operon transcriptional repressor
MIEAATALFLERGYGATSMDDIAAAADVAKQTVYKHFVDKPTLFAEIIEGVVGFSDAILDGMSEILDSADDDVERILAALARYYLEAVLQRRVLQLRRLVISEAGRFPELAHMYYERAPRRGFDLLATAFAAYTERGLLDVADPTLAATQFASLVLSAAQDRAMFHPQAQQRTAELKWLIAGAVRTFLAAYGPRAARSSASPAG